MASFFAELKRRNVFKVGVAYAIVAWLAIQIVNNFFPPLGLPEWTQTLVAVLILIGFPFALLFAWAFELTPEGIKSSKSVNPSESITRETGQKLNYTIIGLLTLAVVFMFVDNYVFVGDRQDSVIERQNTQAGLSESMVESVATQTIEPVAEQSQRLPNSVAILPFKNLSLDPEHAFFAAGIHESTLSQLAKIHDLTVMARTSVMQYENEPPPIPEIAESLKVELVMEGSVQYANDRVLIRVLLIDGLTGAQRWNGEFNRDLSDIFSVQAEVAVEIARAMQVQLLPEDQARIESRPTESAEAYQQYLYALSLPWRRDNLQDYLTALENAISADPEFAEAYAWASGGYNRAGEIERAAEYAHKALDLDPLQGRAHSTLANIYSDYYSRQEEAKEHFNRMLETSPNDPEALGYYCYRQIDYSNDYESAIKICRRALAMDPTLAGPHVSLGFVLMRAGEYEEAIAQLSEAVEIEPDYHSNYLDLALAEYMGGDHNAARQNLDFGVQIMSPEEVFRVDYFAYLYGLIGDTDQVDTLLSRFEGIFGEGDREAGRTLGWGILGTRDKDRALSEWTYIIDGYITEDWPVSIGRITRFRDNWLDDPMLEEPEFRELRSRLPGFEG